MRAQTIDGRGNYQIVATDDDTVWDLKCKVAAKMEGPDATKLRIICSGKELDDDRKYLKDWNIGKNSTVYVLIKGRNTVPAPASDEVPACSSPGSSSTLANAASVLEFDGSDGWALATNLDVRSAQAWFRENFRELKWDTWKNDNMLVYLLNRESNHYREVASFLTEKMGNTAMAGGADKFASVPSCLLDIDEQLRHLLVDRQYPGPDGEGTSLLGSRDTGSFVLGYVQVSKMPVPLREEGAGRNELRAAPTRNGRGLGLHFDSPAYGDVIFTVTLFGKVQVVLKNRTDIAIAKELVGAERGGGCFDAPTQGDVNICAGDAYGIWGKARWKMDHDAIVPPTSTAIKDLDGIARVGLTFRYFRRSFLDLRAGLSPSPEPMAPFTIVDAPFYSRGQIDSAHLYTYVAIVLRFDHRTGYYTLQYLSDGLGADTDWEAFAIAVNVPAAHVLPAVEGARAVLQHKRPWTSRSFILRDEIREKGVDAYLAEKGYVQ